ncbi:Kinesin-like protein KIN-12E [Orobanche minor]
MLGDIKRGARRHGVKCGKTPRVCEYIFSKIQKG